MNKPSGRKTFTITARRGTFYRNLATLLTPAVQHMRQKISTYFLFASTFLSDQNYMMLNSDLFKRDGQDFPSVF